MIPTQGDCVDSLIDWLRNELQHLSYGEVGLSFTVSRGEIKSYQQMKVHNELLGHGPVRGIDKSVGAQEKGY
uniref:Uncharacterized protein n=1 Tax=viral metagenome TaxID=1070528 RepID=A0A6M3Y146_9ZZZZ